jgi:hypothetical protein
LNSCSTRGIMLSQPQKIAGAVLVTPSGVATEMEILMQEHSTLPLFSLQPETKEILLTQGKVAIVDAADYEWLSQWNWHAFRNQGGIWYARRARRRRLDQTSPFMHRVIMDAPSGIMIDHINGDGLDNRQSNLRCATNQQNQFNSRKRRDNTSGFRGVCWREDKKRWRARIRVGGKQQHLGLFKTAEEAARAYDEAAKRLHGEFASLNFNQKDTNNDHTR